MNSMSIVGEIIMMDFIILASVVAAGICAIIVTKNLSGHQINAKIKKKYEEYILELEKSNKRLNGKINQAKQSITISEDAAGEPLGAISEIVDQITPLLPASVRPLLKSKKAVDFIGSYIESHPTAIESIISKFVGNTKPTKSNTDQATEMESTL
jgi:hypothetical protein